MPGIQLLVKGVTVLGVFIICLVVSYLLIRRWMRGSHPEAPLTLAQTIAGAALTIVLSLAFGGATTVVVNNVPAFNAGTTGTRTTSGSSGGGGSADDESPRDPGPFGTFVNAGRNACLDVAEAATMDNAPIVLAACGETDSQSWSVVSYGKAVKIVNRNSGKCLDVQDKDKAEYAQITQWLCYESGGSQLWLGKRVGSQNGATYWRFQNVFTKKCLAPGYLEEVKQMACTDEQSQIWLVPG